MKAELLVIVTQSYPYGSRVDFLEEEIDHLADAFDRVILVPLDPTGELNAVPGNVSVELGPGHRLTGRHRRLLAAVRAPLLVADELRRCRPPRRHPQALAHLLTAAGIAAEVRRWARRAELPPRSIGLTVWLGPAAVGLSGAGLRTVSRAHGGDLFEDRRPHGYQPLQRRAVESCRMVASVSDAGADDLRRRFPGQADCIVTRRLGIAGLERSSRPSADGVLRLMSCSALVDVKRPLLLVDTVREVAARHTDVEWHHFGAGPLLDAVRQRCARELADVRVVLHGAVPNEVVLGHYREHPVDVFLNTSESEGVPVSMMEATSAGTPIVALRVGGVGEIVDDAVGRLLASDASAVSIAEAVIDVAARFADESVRTQVRETWRQRFSSEVNYTSFAAELADLSRCSTRSPQAVPARPPGSRRAHRRTPSR